MTAEAATLTQELVALAPVVVGGLIGILGGLAGTRYGSQLSDRANKEALLRGKLEEAVSASFELKLWLKKEENYFLFRGAEVLEHSPLSRIEMLISLYFPHLLKASNDLSVSVGNYRLYLINTRQAMDKNNNPNPTPAQLQSFGPVNQDFITRQSAFVEAAKSEMSKQLGT